MDLSRLSEKHKRLAVWNSILRDAPLKPELRAELGRKLDEYTRLLNECWESGAIESAQLARMQDIERELQDLDEFSRLRA